MKIDYCSDLHLEFADLYLDKNPESDVLILAGDIFVARDLKDNYDPNGIMFSVENEHRRPDRAIRFLKEECSKYKHVIMVMGNHEHYGNKMYKTASHIKSLLPDNCHLLEKDIFEIDNVVFVGATLWTNLNKGDPLTSHAVKFAMSDFKQITVYKNGIYRKFGPDIMMEEHMKSLEYFRFVCSENRNKKIIVVSHHAPSYKSAHPYFIGHETNYAYSSDLSEFILDNENIKFWIHGHVHAPFDYMIGDTNILCNPRGYLPYEADAKDFKIKTFEV